MARELSKMKMNNVIHFGCLRVCVGEFERIYNIYVGNLACQSELETVVGLSLMTVSRLCHQIKLVTCTPTDVRYALRVPPPSLSLSPIHQLTNITTHSLSLPRRTHTQITCPSVRPYNFIKVPHLNRYSYQIIVFSLYVVLHVYKCAQITHITHLYGHMRLSFILASPYFKLNVQQQLQCMTYSYIAYIHMVRVLYSYIVYLNVCTGKQGYTQKYLAIRWWAACINVGIVLWKIPIILSWCCNNQSEKEDYPRFPRISRFCYVSAFQTHTQIHTFMHPHRDDIRGWSGSGV